MIYKEIIIAIMALLLGACATSSTTTNNYTPSQLRIMVQNGNYPKQGSPTTKSEVIRFSDCLARVSGLISAIGSSYPTRTIVNTNTVRMEKVWTNDGAMTFTCSAADNKLIVTNAPYL